MVLRESTERAARLIKRSDSRSDIAAQGFDRRSKRRGAHKSIDGFLAMSGLGGSDQEIATGEDSRRFFEYSHVGVKIDQFCA